MCVLWIFTIGGKKAFAPSKDYVIILSTDSTALQKEQKSDRPRIFPWSLPVCFFRRKRMKHANVKEVLIDRAIDVLGSAGMDKATTKAIVAGTGISEVYIYRHFANKEDLLAKAQAWHDDIFDNNAYTNGELEQLQAEDGWE